MSKVVLILADGMRPDAVTAVNHAEAKKYLAEGACTLSAATVMPSVTLPCHMSLIHSVDPQRHGILTNTYVPQVRPIDGLFEQLGKHRKTAAFFYNWSELRDLHRPGWGNAPEYEYFISAGPMGYGESNRRLTELTVDCLKRDDPDFTFLYLGEVDEVGHNHGWMGPEYLDAVSRSWDMVQLVREAASPDTVIMVTADHGGHERSHGTDAPEDMTIPFFTWNGPWEKGSSFADVNIKDIAPTVAKLLEVPANRDWEGKALC